MLHICDITPKYGVQFSTTNSYLSISVTEQSVNIASHGEFTNPNGKYPCHINKKMSVPRT